MMLKSAKTLNLAALFYIFISTKNTQVSAKKDKKFNTKKELVKCFNEQINLNNISKPLPYFVTKKKNKLVKKTIKCNKFSKESWDRDKVDGCVGRFSKKYEDEWPESFPELTDLLFKKYVVDCFEVVNLLDPSKGDGGDDGSSEDESSITEDYLKEIILEDFWVTRKTLLNLISVNDNSGFVVRYNSESTPTGQIIVLPENSPPIISDFKSKYGVLGGRRTYYQGTPFAGRHGGIDFYLPPGHNLLAANDGTVLGTKINDNCVGNQFAIDFGLAPDGKTNLIATYMHVGKILVKKGDKVTRGQIVAKAGEQVMTECGGGVEHLHFHMSKKVWEGVEMGWGSFRYLGGPEFWINPHLYWDEPGRPECFREDGDISTDSNRLTLPFSCY